MKRRIRKRHTKCERSQSGQSGMTLVEVVISMLVAGIVLAGLGQALTMGIAMNTESKRSITNLSICKQETEKVKSQVQYSQSNFDGADSNTSFNRTYYADANGNELPSSSSVAPSYQIATAVTNFVDGGGLTLSDANGNVLVKVLTVTGTSLQSALSSRLPAAARQISTNVEMVRPAS